MERIVLFAILSLPVIAISWRTLFNPGSHGFYRFISWECILWLFASNYRFWFYDPFSLIQILSWVFLFLSAYLVIAGALELKRKGKSRRVREDPALYKFENTSELVVTGIFRFIRHPLYASLLFLTWGIWLKNASAFLLVFAGMSSISLYVTARIDEKECVKRFGKSYMEYRKQSTMFIPYLF